MITYRIDTLREGHEQGGNDPNDWHELPRVFTSVSELLSAIDALLSTNWPARIDANAIRIRRIDA